MSTQFLKIHPRLIEVMEFFLLLVKNNQYVTTIKQVKEFIDKCLTHYREQTKNYFDNDEIFTLVYESDIPDDTIVTIEFEES